MERVDFPPWRLLIDRDATVTAHAARTEGGPEECTCSMCHNFAANRAIAYPLAFLGLLDALGIPADRESEVYYLCRSARGAHLYGGWFHFVGEIVERPTPAIAKDGSIVRRLQGVADFVSIEFHSVPVVVPASFRGLQVLQLEFWTEIPWTISEPEPE